MEKPRIALAGFVIGALVGALAMGVVRAAWLAHVMNLEAQSVRAAAAPTSPPIAMNPIPVVPAIAQPCAAPPAPQDSTGAASAASLTSDGGLSAAKTTAHKAVAPRRHTVRSAPRAHTSNPVSSPADDAAFMKAIQSSAGH